MFGLLCILAHSTKREEFSNHPFFPTKNLLDLTHPAQSNFNPHDDIKKWIDLIVKYMDFFSGLAKDDGIPLHDIFDFFNFSYDYSNMTTITELLMNKETTVKQILDYFNSTSEVEEGKEWINKCVKLIQEPFINSLDVFNISEEDFNKYLAMGQTYVNLIYKNYGDFEELINTFGWKQLDLKKHLEVLYIKLGEPKTIKITDVLDIYSYNYQKIIDFINNVKFILDNIDGENGINLETMFSKLNISSEHYFKYMEEVGKIYVNPQIISIKIIVNCYKEGGLFMNDFNKFYYYMLKDFVVSIFDPIIKLFKFEEKGIKEYIQVIQKTIETLLEPDNQFMEDLGIELEKIGISIDKVKDIMKTCDNYIVEFMGDGLPITEMLSKLSKIDIEKIKEYSTDLQAFTKGEMNVIELLEMIDKELESTTIMDQIKKINSLFTIFTKEDQKIKYIFEEILGLWGQKEQGTNGYEEMIKYIKYISGGATFIEMVNLNVEDIENAKNLTKEYVEKTIQEFCSDFNISYENFTKSIIDQLENSYKPIPDVISISFNIDWKIDIIENAKLIKEGLVNITNIIIDNYPKTKETMEKVQEYLEKGIKELEEFDKSIVDYLILAGLHKEDIDKVINEIKTKVQDPKTTFLAIAEAIPIEFWDIKQSLNNFYALDFTTATFPDVATKILTFTPKTQSQPLQSLKSGQITINTIINLTVLIQKATTFEKAIENDQFDLELMSKEIMNVEAKEIVKYANEAKDNTDKTKTKLDMKDLSNLIGYNMAPLDKLADTVNNVIIDNKLNYDKVEEIIKEIEDLPNQPTEVPPPPPQSSSIAKTTTSKGKGSSKSGLIIGCSVAGAMVLVVLVVIGVFIIRRKRMATGDTITRLL